MSIIGFICLIALIFITIRIIKNKKVEWSLYVIYLFLFPFILCYIPFFLWKYNAVISNVLFFLLIAAIFICPLILLLTRFIKNRNSRIIKIIESKPLKLFLCCLLFFSLFYLEFFDGIETFENPQQFIEIKQHIGIGHIAPYKIEQAKNGTATQNYNLFYERKLYIFEDQLYYYPIGMWQDDKYSEFQKENRPPGDFWGKWGEKYNYNDYA